MKILSFTFILFTAAACGGFQASQETAANLQQGVISTVPMNNPSPNPTSTPTINLATVIQDLQSALSMVEAFNASGYPSFVGQDQQLVEQDISTVISELQSAKISEIQTALSTMESLLQDAQSLSFPGEPAELSQFQQQLIQELTADISMVEAAL